MASFFSESAAIHAEPCCMGKIVRRDLTSECKHSTAKVKQDKECKRNFVLCVGSGIQLMTEYAKQCKTKTRCVMQSGRQSMLRGPAQTSDDHSTIYCSNSNPQEV